MRRPSYRPGAMCRKRRRRRSNTQRHKEHRDRDPDEDRSARSYRGISNSPVPTLRHG